ncbi:MAG: hypothetical protein LC800_10110, partial [Acidobacteria bacterium]|nr:hypothetical protein [Acidobacteriota bacterium]
VGRLNPDNPPQAFTPLEIFDAVMSQQGIVYGNVTLVDGKGDPKHNYNTKYGSLGEGNALIHLTYPTSSNGWSLFARWATQVFIHEGMHAAAKKGGYVERILATAYSNISGKPIPDTTGITHPVMRERKISEDWAKAVNDACVPR